MIPAKEFEGELWIRAADIHSFNKHKGGTWVGLTNDEYKELHIQMGLVYYYQDYGHAVEAKLKEKNNG